MHKYVTITSYLIFVLLLWVPQSQAQGYCWTFDPSQAPNIGQKCVPYVHDPVWLLLPGLQGYIDQVLNETYFVNITAAEPILPIACYDSLLSLLCNAGYAPCNVTTEPGYTAGIQYPICRSACLAVNEICSDFFGLFQQTPINCSQPNIFVPDQDQWPIDTFENNFNGLHINTTCTKILPRSNRTQSNLPCPYPLVPVDVPDPLKPPCYIPCPDPTWTPKQWRDIAIIEFSFALVSFISMIFIIIHYVADPRCRKTTKRFQLYSYICQMLFSLAFVFGGPFPQKKVWCQDSTTFGGISKHTCGLQAFLFVVFGLASSIWWAISSSIMYTQLETRTYRISRRKELFYWAMAIGLPVIPFSVAAGIGKVTFYWLTPFCFIQFLIDGTDLDYHYILFYIPLCIPMLVAMGFIAATIYKILQHSRAMRETFKNTEQRVGGVSLFKVNIRLFVWCATLFLFFFTIVIYRSVLEGRWQKLQDDAYAWGVCKVRYELGQGSDALCPESHYPRPIDYGGTVVHYIICTSLGTLSFLAFGTTKNIYIFWVCVARLVYKRDWILLRELLTNEKALNAMLLREKRSSVQLSDGPSKASMTSTTEMSAEIGVELASDRSDVSG